MVTTTSGLAAEVSRLWESAQRKALGGFARLNDPSFSPGGKPMRLSRNVDLRDNHEAAERLRLYLLRGGFDSWTQDSAVPLPITPSIALGLWRRWLYETVNAPAVGQRPWIEPAPLDAPDDHIATWLEWCDREQT
jgi:hypothetical protein